MLDITYPALLEVQREAWTSSLSLVLSRRGHQAPRLQHSSHVVATRLDLNRHPCTQPHTYSLVGSSPCRPKLIRLSRGCNQSKLLLVSSSSAPLRPPGHLLTTAESPKPNTTKPNSKPASSPRATSKPRTGLRQSTSCTLSPYPSCKQTKEALAGTCRSSWFPCTHKPSSFLMLRTRESCWRC